MNTGELDLLYELLVKFEKTMMSNIDPKLSEVLLVLEMREKNK